MCKALLLSLILLPLLASAQMQREALPEVQVQVPVVSDITKSNVPINILPASIDTLDCANTAVYYEIGSGGYYTGTNGSLFLGNFQRFTYEAEEPYQINSVGVAFGTYDSTLQTNRTVAVSIYNDFAANGSLSAPLGVSDSVEVGNIMLPDSFIRFTTFEFPEPVIVNRDSFLVFVDLSDIYESPDGNVAIFSTRDSCGSGENAFVLVRQNNRFAVVPYTNVGNPGANLELFIRVTLDPEVQVRTKRQPLANYSTQISPNPTANRLTLSYHSPGNRSFTATLTDLTGRTLLTQHSNATTSGRNTFEWELGGLPSGLYLYHLDGPAGRQSGKVLKH